MGRLSFKRGPLLVAALAAAQLQPAATGSCSDLAQQVKHWTSSEASQRAAASIASTMSKAELRDCAPKVAAHGEQKPLAAASVLESMARAPACVQELATKTEFQTRCAQFMYKLAITTLVSGGLAEEATAAWERAVQLRAQGPGSDAPSARIKWPSYKQIPTVWMPDLTSKAVWDCSHFPFVPFLEAAAAQILADAQRTLKSFNQAYPYLSQRGEWQNMFLYRGSSWNEELCSSMEATCTLLRGELPSKPAVPFAMVNNEEVILFRSLPGTAVGAHSGATNNQINIHLTLTGANNTILSVDGQRLPLQDGKAICFQDSYLHTVDHPKGLERISLVIRVMHPEVSRSSYRNASSTDAVANLQAWNEKSELQNEIASLRTNYRQLALKVAQKDFKQLNIGTVCGASDGRNASCAAWSQ